MHLILGTPVVPFSTMPCPVLLFWELLRSEFMPSLQSLPHPCQWWLFLCLSASGEQLCGMPQAVGEGHRLKRIFSQVACIKHLCSFQKEKNADLSTLISFWIFRNSRCFRNLKSKDHSSASDIALWHLHNWKVHHWLNMGTSGQWAWYALTAIRIWGRVLLPYLETAKNEPGNAKCWGKEEQVLADYWTAPLGTLTHHRKTNELGLHPKCYMEWLQEDIWLIASCMWIEMLRNNRNRLRKQESAKIFRHR